MLRSNPLRVLLASAWLAWSSVGQAQLPAKVGDTPVPSLAPMIKRVSPAVVNIATKVTIPKRNPLLDDPLFRRFFDLPDKNSGQREARAAGSGVIVDANKGYVLTNAHVVEDASEIDVTLLDNRTIKAELVGSDPATDIALLKVPPDHLVDMPFADSSRTEVGDFVVAIGNPFGLQHTVTSGIVSALGRAGINPDGRNDSYEDFIQTDAAINPGNSGGALVNLSGELVGINSAILSDTGGSIGIGFAIPANMARTVMDQLVKYGKVKHARLGVSIRTLSPNVAESLGLKNTTSGVLVAEVLADSPAAQAGIKAGDIITAVNDKAVKTDVDLRNTIGFMRSGDRANLSVLREGNPTHIVARLGSADIVAADKPAKNLHAGFEGAELADVGNDGGVIVRNVAPRSPAAQHGLKPNDVIVAVGRTRIANFEQLRATVKDSNAFALTVKRGDNKVVVVID